MTPLLFLAGCWFGGLRLNLTSSLPVGLYTVSHGMPTRGALVLVCLPRGVADFARDRGYVPRGGSCPGGLVPIGKPVFAIPGDTVGVSPDGLRLNGRLVENSKPLDADREGRRLLGPSAGRYIVGRQQIWLMSGYSPYSYDSRYFGPVPVASIRSYIQSCWPINSHIVLAPSARASTFAPSAP